MKWRYQNLRIVLLRPVLLNLANRGNEGSATREELEAIAKCRVIAKQTIDDIAREWTANQMLGWNGVWFMYQASMIPLVSIFWENWNTQQVRECQAQIEVVLETFEGLSDWSLAARRSREVVSKMYEASKRPMTRQASPRLGPLTPGGPNGHVTNMSLSNAVNGITGGHEMNGVHINGMPIMNNEAHGMNGHHLMHQNMQHHEQMMDEGMLMMEQGGVWDLDGMLWSNLPDGLDMPWDGIPNMEVYDDRHFDGSYMMQQ
jgi:hypothetical protein